MNDEGKIASRIFSKHLVIQDEFDDEQEKDESIIKLDLSSSDKKPMDPPEQKKGDEVKEKTDHIINISKDKGASDVSQTSEADNKIPEIGDLSEEFTHAAALGGNPEEIKLEGFNDFFEGENKMLDEKNTADADKVTGNENTQPQFEEMNFDNEEGETLVLNFQTPIPETIQIPEFQDSQAEEFPQEISLFQNADVKGSQQPETIEATNLEDQSSQVENVEAPKFEFIDEEDEQQEEPNDDSIIDDSQGRVIEEDPVEQQPVNEKIVLEKRQNEEESEIDGITADFPELQDISLEIKGFLLNNIDIFTKERLAICMDLGLELEELKGFFVGNLKEEHKKEIYSKLRKVEMQYIFENFIQCFNIEGFTRKKETIDGNTVSNIVVLNEDVFIDEYEGLNTTKDSDVKPGESAFILNDELEINIENYIDEIKTAKLNATNVYLMILDGAIVDEDAVKLATRYGIRIVDMDTPISAVNRNLEEIKKGIIV